MITIKQVAETLNMSPTTVSNVIHGKTKEVSKETIDRVQQYLEEVHYVPNISARNLAQNQSNIIGIVLKTSEDRYAHILCDPFVSEMLGGIEKAVREAGYYMMLYISEDITEIINRVTSWNVDGLLLFWMHDDDAIRVYKRFKKPVVYVDTYVNWKAVDKIGQTYVNVGLTDEESTYEAMKYLIGKGHRKIGFVSEKKSGVNLQRLKGFKRALKEADIKTKESRYYELETTASGIDASLKSIAKEGANVTAFLCTSDNFAGMLINACEAEGLRVPQDISIMGFDDSHNVRLIRPALTTMHQDISRKGLIATEELIKMIDGKVPEEHQIILTTNLIERDSVSNLDKTSE